MQGHSTRLITLATGMLLAGLLSRPGAAVEPGQGYTVFARLAYRLWGPEENPMPKSPLVYK